MFGTITKGLVKGLENLEIRGQVKTRLQQKIGQNTEKSHGELRRLAVTKTPVENHYLMLVWKTLKGIIMIIIIMWWQRQNNQSHNKWMQQISTKGV